MTDANKKNLLPQNQTIDDIPSTLLDDCAQLVKANSIQGMIKICLYKLQSTNDINVLR